MTEGLAKHGGAPFEKSLERTTSSKSKYLEIGISAVRNFTELFETGSEIPKVRLATEQDIDRFVDIELQVWKETLDQGKTQDELREELSERFTKRYRSSPSGVFVAEVDEVIEGWISFFRSSKNPKEIDSWEGTTNNGTHEGVVDELGKNFYISNLTVTPKGSLHNVTTMLEALVFSRLAYEGLDKAIFCSRIPGFSRWVDKNVSSLIHAHVKNAINEIDLAQETKSQLIKALIFEAPDLNSYGRNAKMLVKAYVDLHESKPSGEKLRREPLLRVYEAAGAKFVKVTQTGMENDPESLNFGVIGYVENFVPEKLRLRPINITVSKLIDFVVARPNLSRKFFGN